MPTHMCRYKYFSHIQRARAERTTPPLALSVWCKKSARTAKRVRSKQSARSARCSRWENACKNIKKKRPVSPELHVVPTPFCNELQPRCAAVPPPPGSRLAPALVDRPTAAYVGVAQLTSALPHGGAASAAAATSAAGAAAAGAGPSLGVGKRSVSERTHMKRAERVRGQKSARSAHSKKSPPRLCGRRQIAKKT